MSKTATKRVLPVIMAVLLAATMTTMLGACSSGSESVIRHAISRDFDAIKAKNPEYIAPYRTGLDAMFLDTNVDVSSVVNAWLDSFDYKIGEVKVSDNNATARVEITVKQPGPVADVVYNDFSIQYEEDESFLELEADELYGKLCDQLVQAMSDEAATTTVINLPFVLNGNTWEQGPEFQNELAKAFVGRSIMFTSAIAEAAAGITPADGEGAEEEITLEDPEAASKTK